MKTVETLGSATVICTDKTGTITENKMTLAKLFVLKTNTISETENVINDDEKSLIRTAMRASEPIPFYTVEIALLGAEFSLLIGIVITYCVVQFILGWVLEPLILGPQVKINPLFTILALVLGELLWEISGINLAISVTAIFKIICDHIEPMKPYGFLIGEMEIKKG